MHVLRSRRNFMRRRIHKPFSAKPSASTPVKPFKNVTLGMVVETFVM